MEYFSLYVSDAAESGFLRILILIMLLPSLSSSSTLIIVTVGGSISDCTSTLRQLPNWEIFMVSYLCIGEMRVLLSHIVTLKSAVRVS